MEGAWGTVAGLRTRGRFCAESLQTDDSFDASLEIEWGAALVEEVSALADNVAAAELQDVALYCSLSNATLRGPPAGPAAGALRITV
jgi:hypothetical protein